MTPDLPFVPAQRRDPMVALTRDDLSDDAELERRLEAFLLIARRLPDIAAA